jgi:hypothetical protein
MASGPSVQHVTKLEAARRQLVTAIRLFFDDREPVSIHTLAHASWEICSTLCGHEGITTAADYIAQPYGTQPFKDLRRKASKYKNFFKHADRDPIAALDDFGDTANDDVLFAAVIDLAFYCDEKLPIEATAFYLWYYAVHAEPDNKSVHHRV